MRNVWLPISSLLANQMFRLVVAMVVLILAFRQTVDDPKHPENALIMLGVLYAFFQLSIAAAPPVPRGRYEYVLMPIEFGSISEYFKTGEPTALSKEYGWVTYQIHESGVLFRRLL